MLLRTELFSVLGRRHHTNINSLADQPFVVGLNFSPIPAKLVSQIQSGKFVNLWELLVSNWVSSESEPQLMFNGHLVLSAPPKIPRPSAYRGYHCVDGSLHGVFSRLNIVSPPSLERSNTVQATNLADLPPV